MRLNRGAPLVRLVGRGAVAALISTAVIGCGTEVSGTATRTVPDTSDLNFGNYQTEPRVVGNAKSMAQARAWEAQRLADYVALPFEIDPAYVRDNRLASLVPGSQIILNQKGLGALVINDTFDEVAEDLVAGWLNSWTTFPDENDKVRELHLSVLIFPDAETAESVGPTLEHDDFTFTADNEPVQITKYPKTFAHWRPTVSSIGSWTVHDRYVIFMKIEDETRAPDLTSLTSQVERVLEVQIPLLDEFEPTPADQLEHVPLDPTGLLGRTLPSDPSAPTRPTPDGYSTGRGAVSLFVESEPGLLSTFKTHGIDLISFGDTVVFRAKTASGANGLFQEWTGPDPGGEPTENEQPAPAPVGIDTPAVCIAYTYESQGEVGIAAYLCTLQVDKYVVQVRNRNLQDLHQQVAAQYILLTAR